jgi:hypothetical protein
MHDRLLPRESRPGRDRGCPGSRGAARWTLIGAATAAAVLALTVGAGQAAADVPIPPYLPCALDSAANLATLEASLLPAPGASTAAGATVTFSGLSSQPVDFAVASSAGAIAAPDVDGGPGSIQGAPAGAFETWAFASTKAAATTRTVFWGASFSDAAVPSCAGQTPVTYTTKARELTVTTTPPPVEVPAAPIAAVSSCVVPALHGDRPRGARLALRAADCRAGRVSRPPHAGRGPLIVVGQSPPSGRTLPAGSRVALRLGTKLRSR